MKKIKELVEGIQEYDFKSEYKRECNSLIKIKFQALHYLQSGKLLKDVSDIVLYDEQAVRSWVRRFIRYDYEGLIEKKEEGKSQDFQKKKKMILKMPSMIFTTFQNVLFNQTQKK